MSNLKTALFDFHVSQGAKMRNFAGFQMRVQYSFGIIIEHDHAKAAAGIIDVLHKVQLSIVGNNGVCSVVVKIITIDLSELKMNHS